MNLLGWSNQTDSDRDTNDQPPPKVEPGKTGAPPQLAQQPQQPAQQPQPQQQPQQQQPQQAGKGTLIGDQYIDHGAACGTGPNCFLEDGQRTRLIGAYQGRVTQAQEAYRHALAQLRVDKLLQKLENDQKSNLPWMFSLIIDVVGLHALSSLTSALETLLKVEKENLLNIVENAAKGGRASRAAEKMWDGLHKITPSHLYSLSKKASDKATKAAQSQIKRATKEQGPNVQNAIDTGYIDYLMDHASLAFQALREEPPGIADDASMVALWKAFDGSNHTVSHYKDELTQKLARFNASGIMDVGREAGGSTPAFNEELQVAGKNPSLVNPAPMGASDGVNRDRTIVQIQFLSGRASQYATAHRDWYVGEQVLNTDQPDPARKTEGEYRGHQTTYKTAFRNHDVDVQDKQGKTITVHFEREFHLEKLIAPEFADIAVERHNAQWRRSPWTIRVDDRPARYAAGAPMPSNFKPEGNYVIKPSPALDINDPTTWWGFKEHRPVGSVY